ncbi:hypothetical protein F8388_022722 [Cannabis sativa]|uniref:Uncharacterized protein n=1 Tax=Cannabis sativa TaxID=3483 RepID=A0A7J6G212_CANSA|nr:hypothetical protein F8388_022722 [Cannabis sativa]
MDHSFPELGLGSRKIVWNDWIETAAFLEGRQMEHQCWSGGAVGKVVGERYSSGHNMDSIWWKDERDSGI